MRRFTAGEVLAAAAGAGLTGTRSFALVAPAHPTPPRIVHEGSRRPVLAQAHPTQQHTARQGGGEEDEAYREDDQRMFWDTVAEVLTQELGTGDQLARVWEFVRHNREGADPPRESPSFRATGLYFPGLEAKPYWDRSEFAWLKDLEEAAPDIALEMGALARAGGGASYKGGSGEMSTVYDATQGWGTMRLRYMGRFAQPGINYALLPRTLSTLRRLPLAPETVAFQRQLPGTGLPLHVDPSNFVLGCHLGVVIPSPAGGPEAAASNAAPAGGSGAVGGRRRGKKRRGRASGIGAAGGGGGVGFGGAGGVAAAAGLKKRENGGGAGGAGGANGPEDLGDGGGDGRWRGESRDGSSESTAYRPPRHTGEGDGRLDDVAEAFAGKADGRAAAATAAVVVDAEDNKSNGDRLLHAPPGGGVVGDRAWIEVSGEKRHWQTGRAFVFDPSFLHRTRNPTAGERVILNVDIWHPGLEEVEKTAVRRVCEMVEQWNTRTGLFK